MKAKKVLAMVLAGVMAASCLAGCNQSTGTKSENTAGNTAQSSEANGDAVVDLEIWTGNNGFKAVEKGGAIYNFYKDLIGVGVIQPYVEWNGGANYQQQLNLKIVAGEMPDIFYSFNGMESDLIKNNALLDLTDLIQEKAPHLWATIPEEAWDAMKAMDPSGEGRIYMVPSIVDYNLMSGLIRQDWLDKLGLPMPTTQEEFVNVLEAFKTQDPNGNGIADEIPTGGRADAKWMDHLFGMYGLAMTEGSPQWDIYDGELTYAAVTPNMKDALAFMKDLYERGLMDPETFLNDKASWEGKIFSNKVGVAYHWSEVVREWGESTENATGLKPDWVVLPAISAPGYEGFYTTKQVQSGGLVVKKTDDQTVIDAVMKVLDVYGNQDLWQQMYTGVEGMHSEMIDGKLIRKADDKATMEHLALEPWSDMTIMNFKIGLFEDMITSDNEWAVSQSIRNIKESQQYGKLIAGDGIPSSIYDDYPDIMNKTLYIEYACKIIIGEYNIDKFDEFVERWYASGGEAVTQAAREWYAKTQQ